MSGISVSFRACYISDAADLANPLQFRIAYPSEVRDTGAQVRAYAGGRRRTIRTAGRHRQLDVVIRMVTPVELAKLDALAGKLVLYRDHRGRRIWGMFPAISISEPVFDDRFDVGLTLTEQSHVEAV